MSKYEQLREKVTQGINFIENSRLEKLKEEERKAAIVAAGERVRNEEENKKREFAAANYPLLLKEIPKVLNEINRDVFNSYAHFVGWKNIENEKREELESVRDEGGTTTLAHTGHSFQETWKECRLDMPEGRSLSVSFLIKRKHWYNNNLDWGSLPEIKPRDQSGLYLSCHNDTNKKWDYGSRMSIRKPKEVVMKELDEKLQSSIEQMYSPK